MKTLPVGEFKAQFSSVLKDVENGQSVAITYGKKRAKLAVLVPYDQYAGGKRRRLGVLKGKAKYVVHDDFKLSDEEFLIS